jgi:AP-3 complex subunit mu
MINSLFIVNNSGDIFMEKHWKSVIHRSICDYFFEAQSKCNKPEDIPCVISAPHHKLIVVYRNKLYFIAVVLNEVSPLFVIEIIHRAVDIFEDYFGECNETSLKENYVIVYEV